MKCLFYVIILFISILSLKTEAHQIDYVNPKAYKVTYSVKINNIDAYVNSLEIYMPFPKEYECQRDVNVGGIQPPGYQLNSEPNDKARILYWLKIGEPKKGNPLTFYEKFDYICYEINTFIDVNNIAPYDTQSQLYQDNTISEKYIEASDPLIIQKAQELADANNNPYKSARSFYDWVREHTYWKAVYGLKGALFTLQNGYGECGDYSALFCALCRASGIPARPVVGFWASSGTPCHVWAEFYIEGCGWIPVDPSVGDDRMPDYYFGNLDNNRLIFSKGYNINLVPPPAHFPVDPVVALFQTYFWWWSGSGWMTSDMMLEVEQNYLFSISLAKGWNLISLPVSPTDKDILSVMSSVADKFESIWAFEPITKEWLSYVRNGSSSLNALYFMDAGSGYWIYMSEPGELRIKGTFPGRIVLKKGWNLAGYNLFKAQDRSTAMLSIAGKYSSVCTYDALNGIWLIYIVNAPPFLNNMTTMEPCKGYWIYAEQDCLWTLSP
jgi:hypothetical protein